MILVLVCVLARSCRGVVFLELCFTLVADVVAVSVYVLFTGLVDKVAKYGNVLDSGNLLKKTAGREQEHGDNKHCY